MVIAHHLICTSYGSWLPNDPRGSMTRGLPIESVAALGPSHYGRKRAHPPSREILAFYRRAENVLEHPVLPFDSVTVPIVAEAFAETIRNRGYVCFACAIMADHIHMVVRRHRDSAEEMIANLQRASAVRLLGSGFRPPDHPVWGGPGWNVFLHHRCDVERVVEYVRQNPLKARRPEQHWGFVMPYDGWLPGLHPERRPRTRRPQTLQQVGDRAEALRNYSPFSQPACGFAIAPPIRPAP